MSAVAWAGLPDSATFTDAHQRQLERAVNRVSKATQSLRNLADRLNADHVEDECLTVRIAVDQIDECLDILERLGS